METDPVIHQCQLLLIIIHKTFKYGAVTEKVAWDTMVFLPEVRGEYRRIGTVEVVWKVCATVVNFQLKKSVALHDALHGFRAGMGIRTATLEEKLSQQFAGIVHEPMFQVFLDARKTYESLDRGRCMEILRGYEMGQRMARLIAHHWDNLMFVPKAKRFIGKPFGTGRGVMQEDPTPPMIFNIVVDAVATTTLEVVYVPQEALHGMGWATGE